ncbi:MAG: hypothetical protein EBT02_00615 [Planctomycetia bacterium]|nr:hypothetical protein [Planctomycetia bacterium]
MKKIVANCETGEIEEIEHDEWVESSDVLPIIESIPQQESAALLSALSVLQEKVSQINEMQQSIISSLSLIANAGPEIQMPDFSGELPPTGEGKGLITIQRAEELFQLEASRLLSSYNKQIIDTLQKPSE